jgi:hypothetical protein
VSILIAERLNLNIHELTFRVSKKSAAMVGTSANL